MSEFNWTCPHCDRAVTITPGKESRNSHVLTIDNATGQVVLKSHFIVCPNPDCTKLTLNAEMREWKVSGSTRYEVKTLRAWRLYPEGSGKVFPDYIPAPIREDYLEACLIRDLSPKASATLSRRCLQGMIRDFWKVNPARLINEIKAIRDKVDPSTWEAIDAVREMGNIGAHMEKDIGVIVDVDPDEAAMMIDLVEMLLEEWYVTKHDRESRMASLIATAAAKRAASLQPSPPPAPDE